MKKRLILFLLSLFGLSLSSCGTTAGIYPDADKYLVGNQTYTENIKVLDVDWLTKDIVLVEDENIEGVKVEEETSLTKDEEKVHSYLNNGELKIKFFASGYTRSGFDPYTKKLTITYKPGLETLNLRLTSGSFKADKITATNVNFDITSGLVSVENLYTDKVYSHSTSGSVSLKNIEAKEFKGRMTSGSLLTEFITIDKADYELTSGNLNIVLPEDGGKVKVSKTSGSIIAKREATIDGDSYTFGNGKAEINVSMTSGNVIIN